MKNYRSAILATAVASVVSAGFSAHALDVNIVGKGTYKNVDQLILMDAAGTIIANVRHGVGGTSSGGTSSGGTSSGGTSSGGTSSGGTGSTGSTGNTGNTGSTGSTDNTPPAGCPAKSDVPYDKIQPLFTGLQRVAVTGGEANVYSFNSNRFIPSGLFSLGGEPAQEARTPSLNTAITVSNCPGDFNIAKLGYSCVAGGREPGLRVKVGGTASYADCRLEPNRTYYFNVSPLKLGSKAVTCASKCGVAFQGTTLAR